MKTYIQHLWLAMAFIVMIASGPILQSAESDTTAQAANAAKLKEWQDMRFGMFIHWGPVSLKGTEIGWSRGSQVPVDEYDLLYKRFNPEQFDADAWARTAKEAGMKYIVFTSKHHDGFCMWDTQQTDFNVMRSPFAKDVLKELSAACRRQGIAFSTYHSVCDWHHPDFPRASPGGRSHREVSNLDRYEKYIRAQVKELITGYGPLQTMWFDVPQEFDQARGLALEAWTRSLQPDIIINNRSGAQGDYDTPEQRVGKYQDVRPWETCMTICRQWAWKPDDDMKTLKDCLQNLIRCAGGNGNLLFNVGPMPDGRIEPRQVGRLKEMGQWLAVHGESIYGTRGGPWKPARSVASTRKGNSIYLHVLRWDGNQLELPDIDAKVVKATLLGGGKTEVRQVDGKLLVEVSEAEQNAIDTVIRLELNRSAMDLPAVALGLSVKAEASNVFRNQVHHFGAEMAFDNDNETRWATDSGIQEAWITGDLLKPLTVQRIRIEEAMGQRIKAFEFQYRKDEKWNTLFKGQKIGRWFQHKLDQPVIAREFRLHILEASDGPTIADIEFFE
ncbi:alpha-L-fucosidase [bacterium]|nr:alpha-L-fucosidase [bacterium]